jgi:hypothetical protein
MPNTLLTSAIGELLHFFAPNHGKLWKSLMRVHLGDYEKAQAQLEKAGGPLPWPVDC